MSLLPQEIIRHKRDGKALSTEELQAFADGLTHGSFTEGQVAALAMAVFFQGMSMDERIALTRAMTQSGEVLDWTKHDFGKPIVDKHSTGGVGDKVSLMLAPMLAACGTVVPMISGRGLGHTGGTLDKLEAIEGYVAKPDADLWGKALHEAGCAIIGQTRDIAPADRRFYSIRDVTATVESIPLITASILSKKLAAGLQRLVIDVKFGSGAFASSYEMAQELARSLVDVATGAGLPTTALLTDMNEVLGRTAGNAVETRESIDYLTGAARDPRLHEVTLALCSELLVGVGQYDDDTSARAALQTCLDDGSAAERFAIMVRALGGPADLVENPDAHLPLPEVSLDVTAEHGGVVERIDTRAVGIAVVDLGGGRRRPEDNVDPLVGLTNVAGLGETIDAHRPLCRVHARTPAQAESAAAQIRAAFTLGNAAIAPTPIVVERICASPDIA
ncbi:MAG: thymidine phosphorylase [Nannocystaceae bacterium]|nr:thymidine phosphorylase [Nannocystaceae bacterium]